MDLAGKRVILTGAASGIGAALLTELVKAGSKVIAVDLNTESIVQQPQVYPVRCDVSQPDALDALFVTAVETFGGVDLCVANAGFAYYEQIEDADWARIDRIFRVNAYAPLYMLTKMALLHADGQPYTVVMTASAMAHLGLPGYALYGATKAALHRFAEAYRLEMPAHSHLMLVYPIATRTGFFAASSPDTPMAFPSQTPDYVARRIMAGLRRDASAVRPSPTFIVYQWLTAVLPPLRWLYWSLALRQFRRYLRRRQSH